MPLTDLGGDASLPLIIDAIVMKNSDQKDTQLRYEWLTYADLHYTGEIDRSEQGQPWL